MAGRLQDQVVIVTGGGGGIGREYCRRLVEEGALAAVADVDLAAAEATVARCGDRERARAVQVDVADAPSVQAMADTVLGWWGRIDGLVNNAAIFTSLKRQPFEDIPLDEWDRVMTVNTRSLFLCSRAVMPAMRKQGRGKIVNIASGTILWGSPNLLHYVTSKGAVFAFTRALAREVGSAGVQVNTLAPGFVLTEVTAATEDPSTTSRSRSTRVIQRDETPEDLTGTLVYLLSSDSDFVTGQMVVVNGGAQMW